MNTYPDLESYTADVEAARAAYEADRSVEQGYCAACHTTKKDGHMRRCARCRRSKKLETKR